MNRENYLGSPEVQSFIEWVLPRISGEIPFIHRYRDKRRGNEWNCHSIYNAYENYHWPFVCSLPDGVECRGSSFEESHVLLASLAQGLRNSLAEGDGQSLLQYCLSLLKWGGVQRSNYQRLCQHRTKPGYH